MAELTAEKARKLLHYDPKSGKLTWKVNKGPARIGKEARGQAVHGYLRVRVEGKLYYIHRIAYLIMMGHFPFMLIDHRNRCRTDNRWANLRVVSNAENVANSGARRNNRLGVKGVYLQDGSYKSYIKINGKTKYLGRFTTIEAASEAYQKAHVELYDASANGDAMPTMSKASYSMPNQ